MSNAELATPAEIPVEQPLEQPAQATFEQASPVASLAGEGITDSSEKIATMRSLVDELTGDGELSPAARDFVRKGGSVSWALEYMSELGAQQAETGPKSEMTETDEKLMAARGIYAEALGSRSRKKKRVAEAGYAQALIEKVQDETGVEPGKEQSLEESLQGMAQQELAVVSKILLEERENLRSLVGETSKPNRIAKLLENKKLRSGMIIGVLGSSVAARTGILPIESEETVHTIEHSLDAMTSYLFVAGSQNELYQRTKAAVKNHKQKKDAAEISKDMQTLELSQHTIEHVGGQEEDTPYSEQEAVALVSHIYGKHIDAVRTVAGEEEHVTERYVELVSTLVREEVHTQRREITDSKIKSIVFHSIALASAATLTATTYRVAESVSLTRDLKETLPDHEQ